MGSWHQSKLFIEHSLAIDHDALHILAGIFVWLALALLLRRTLGSWWPWAGVFALDIWNEAVDLSLEQWPDRGWQYGETAKDIVLTILIPTLFLILIRLRPDLFGHRADAAPGIGRPGRVRRR